MKEKEMASEFDWILSLQTRVFWPRVVFGRHRYNPAGWFSFKSVFVYCIDLLFNYCVLLIYVSHLEPINVMEKWRGRNLINK